jgi:hypothetical protein
MVAIASSRLALGGAMNVNAPTLLRRKASSYKIGPL